MKIMQTLFLVFLLTIGIIIFSEDLQKAQSNPRSPLYSPTMMARIFLLGIEATFISAVLVAISISMMG